MIVYIKQVIEGFITKYDLQHINTSLLDLCSLSIQMLFVFMYVHALLNDVFNSMLLSCEFHGICFHNATLHDFDDFRANIVRLVAFEQQPMIVPRTETSRCGCCACVSSQDIGKQVHEIQIRAGQHTCMNMPSCFVNSMSCIHTHA